MNGLPSKSPAPLNSEDDPVLARIWDNDEDDVYDFVESDGPPTTLEELATAFGKRPPCPPEGDELFELPEDLQP